jgi:hypothetical protein
MLLVLDQDQAKETYRTIRSAAVTGTTNGSALACWHYAALNFV